MSNPIDDLLDAVDTGKGKLKGKQFNSPLAEALDFSAADATDRKDSRKAGKYLRKTFTLTPRQIADIERLALKYEISLNDIARWIVDVGLEAAASGRKPKLKKLAYRKVYDSE